MLFRITPAWAGTFYIDDAGCYYPKKGQSYLEEYEDLIVIIKDYGFSLGVRMFKNPV